MKQKLIDQLIHRAGARFGGDGINYDGFVPSKFAELIVIKCLDIVDKKVSGMVGVAAMKEIEEYFGVKE